MKKALVLMFFFIATLCGVCFYIFADYTVFKFGRGVGDFFEQENLNPNTISMPDSHLLLLKKDGVWQTELGYPVDAKKVESFLDALQKAKIVEKKYSPKPEKFREIILLEKQEELKTASFFVYNTESGFEEVWQNDEKYRLSTIVPFYEQNEGWFYQPLVHFTSGEEHPLSGVKYIQAMKVDDAWRPINKFVFSLKEGLIFECSLYYHDNQYWLGVEMSTDIMPQREALVYAKNNAPLLNGWVFLLSQTEGKRLRNF